MKTKQFHRTVLASAALGIAVTLGATGTAMATPTLSITAPTNAQEVTGDAGGTNYAVGYGTYNGPGLPSVNAGWPNTGLGLGPDPSFGGAVGTTGWHSSYLDLTGVGAGNTTDVTFQFMGKGNATLVNSFYVDRNQDGDYADAGEELFRGGTTTACAMFGGTVPSCDVKSGGPLLQNEYTLKLGDGRIKFAYMTGNGVLLQNSGAGNGNPDPHTQTGLPGYFLGVDPYLAAGTYQTSGSAVYAGLTDLPSTGDHDFQDLGVRISVPEPGGLALVLAAFGGLALTRRRSKQA